MSKPITIGIFGRETLPAKLPKDNTQLQHLSLAVRDTIIQCGVYAASPVAGMSAQIVDALRKPHMARLAFRVAFDLERSGRLDLQRALLSALAWRN